MISKQKYIFLKGEADAWFKRNCKTFEKTDFRQDEICLLVTDICESYNCQLRILEVGCSGGDRLKFLSDILNCEVHGIDPSEMAVGRCRANNINALVGTADHLPYEDSFFDILIFGFCLYLCDRDDLFKIVSEANRVLKDEGWVIIKDFYAKQPMKRFYQHADEVYSYKMDYASLFTCHPNYVNYHQQLFHHKSLKMTDSSDDWVAVSAIRKLDGLGS